MVRKNYNWKVDEPLPELAPHSSAKHRIFARYLERYIGILNATSAQEELNLTIVDGYSGGGAYRQGNEIVAGSPLIFLRAVATIEAKLNLTRSKGFKINAHFYFTDAVSAHAESLIEELKRSEFADELGRTIFISSGDFNDLIANIISKIQTRQTAHRSLFFLDQNGWSQASFQTIRTILYHLKNPEIFLTFSVDALIDYISEKKYDFRSLAAVDITPEFVREIVSIREEDQAGWRTVIQNTLYAHIQNQTGAPHYSPFFIKASENHRSYWLLHLSKHPEARNEMGNIHWAESNASVHHGGAGFNALGFSTTRDPYQLALGSVFDEPAKEQSLKVVAEQVPAFVRAASLTGVRSLSLRELFVARCNDTPVTRAILEKVAVELRQAKEITIESKTGRGRPRAETLTWDDRIVIPPQRSFWGPITGAFSKKS
jgi:three-Cys-motif partner protein